MNEVILIEEKGKNDRFWFGARSDNKKLGFMYVACFGETSKIGWTVMPEIRRIQLCCPKGGFFVFEDLIMRKQVELAFHKAHMGKQSRPKWYRWDFRRAVLLVEDFLFAQKVYIARSR